MEFNPMNLRGQRILVTGASSGIGRACAVILDQLGAELILLGRNLERLQETEGRLSGSGHQTVVFDLENIDGIKPLAQSLGLRERRLSGVVHSAGAVPIVPLNASTHAVMTRALTVNFLSFVEIARVFASRLHFSAKGGSMVAISSVAGARGWIGGSAYCSAKAALESFVRVAALEFAPKKIRVNTVAPSFVATPMLKDPDGFADFSVEKLNTLQPLGIGAGEDVAQAVAFLLSDAARFITGTRLVVDGGFSAK